MKHARSPDSRLPALSVGFLAVLVATSCRSADALAASADAQKQPTAHDLTVVLRNGDRLTGLLVNKSLHVKTKDAIVQVEPANLLHLSMTGRQNGPCRIVLRGAAGTFEGVLNDKEVEIRLDGGQTVRLHRNRIAEIVAAAPVAARRKPPDIQHGERHRRQGCFHHGAVQRAGYPREGDVQG